MNWFMQRKNWELGNFVMATPMLRGIMAKTGHPVPVFFMNKHVESLYLKCPFIVILDKRPTQKAFDTTHHPLWRKKRESDSEAWFRKWVGPDLRQMTNTYVDPDRTMELERKKDVPHIAVFHGCLHTTNQKLIAQKALPPKVINLVLKRILSRGGVPVLIGSTSDKRFFSSLDLSGCMNFIGELKLKDSVSLLSQCDFFVGNDTGLYHVAGARKVPGVVLWKQTKLDKNRSTFSGITYVVSAMARLDRYKTVLTEKLNEVFSP
jgi:ADP-heptose:LPS heptosyltransferase